MKIIKCTKCNKLHFIMQEILNLLRNAEKEATKARMIELLAKIKQMYKDNNTQVALFQGVDRDIQALASRVTDDTGQSNSNVPSAECNEANAGEQSSDSDTLEESNDTP